MQVAWFTLQTLAEIKLSDMPSTRFGLAKAAEREGWTARPRAKGKGLEYHISSLPKQAQVELINHFAPPPEALPNFEALAYLGQAEKQQDVGHDVRRDAKAMIVKAFDKYRFTLGLSVMAAEREFLSYFEAQQAKGSGTSIPSWVFDAVPRFSVQSLRNWRAIARKKDGHKALGAQYGNRRGKGIIDLAENGEFKTYLIALKLKTPHITGGNLRDLCRIKFGETVSYKGAQRPLPTVRTIERFISKWCDDHAEIHEKITNPDSHKNKYQLALGKRDDGIVRLNQLWEIDASPADILCADGRYTLYSIVDVYSRRAIFTVSKTASTDASLLIMRRAILEWGVPEILRTDNGSDFTSHRFVQALLNLGIEQELCDPYAGEQKPFVERSFRTLQHDLMPLLPGYIGHSVADRKAIEGRKAFGQRLGEKTDKAFCVELTHQDLAEHINSWVKNKYSHQPHSGINKQTPFARAAAWKEPLRRIENIRSLDLLLAPIAGQHGIRTVGKKAVRLQGGSYFDSGLIPYVGKRVFVRCDPDDMGVIYCFTEDKEFICEARDFSLTGSNPAIAAAEAKKARKVYEAEQMREIKKDMNKITATTMARDMKALYERDNGHITSFPKAAETHSTPDLEQANRATSKTPITNRQTDKEKVATVAFRKSFAIEKAKISPTEQRALDEKRYLKRVATLEAELETVGSLDDTDQEWLDSAYTRPWYVAHQNLKTMSTESDALAHQEEPKN